MKPQPEFQIPSDYVGWLWNSFDQPDEITTESTFILWVDIILRINYVTGKQGIQQRLSCGVIPDSLQLFPETIVGTSVKVSIRCTTSSSMLEKEATILVTQRRANAIVSTFFLTQYYYPSTNISVLLLMTKHFISSFSRLVDNDKESHFLLPGADNKWWTVHWKCCVLISTR